MRQKLIILLFLMIPVMAIAQENQNWKRQMRFGWSGYPVTESIIHTWSWSDWNPVTSLRDIYNAYQKPMYTTGGISAEIAWLNKERFTFALTLSGNFTWQGNIDAVTNERIKPSTSLMFQIVPQARFNWVRRDLVKMYSSIGIGAIIGYDLDKEFGLLPTFQINPVGIEVGRKVFGFCECGLGMMYLGGMVGVGYRF
jgi:hypothetical protein